MNIGIYRHAFECAKKDLAEKKLELRALVTGIKITEDQIRMLRQVGTASARLCGLEWTEDDFNARPNY